MVARHRWLTFLVFWFLAVCLAIGLDQALSATPPIVQPAMDYTWNLPAWAPKPVVPADNPMTADKAELGRHLFYEKRLSITGKFSCASCHEQARAFTDGKAVAVGTTGETHPRNAMSLANVAYNSVLTWANPLMTRLETQALVPLFGEHPVEMGLVGKEDQILTLLRQEATYQTLFTSAFPGEKEPVTLNHLVNAIATFERSLVSFNSPYDRYRYGGKVNAISAAAKRGETLFHSERLECFHCHGGLNLSDSTVHERSTFQESAFHNTGLYNIDGKGAFPPDNTGTYEITHEPFDMGRFKAPTLRNIALTAPYMHDGSILTLEEAIAHYQAGGRTIRKEPYAGVGSENPYKSLFISGFQLSKGEKQDLLAFLRSLTDESFTQNPMFSNPN